MGANRLTKRIDQAADRTGSIASLPRDEDLPGRLFVDNRNDNNIGTSKCLTNVGLTEMAPRTSVRSSWLRAIGVNIIARPA